jgi:hypothetical protein
MNAVVPDSRRADLGNGRFWALVPVLLLGLSSAGLLVMASIAGDDPGFALEQDYYARAVNFDQEQRQRGENERLGYHVRLDCAPGRQGTELVVAVTDRTGAKLEGAAVSVEAFANARAGDIRRMTFVERQNGTYAALLGAARPGIWEFRFVVERDGDRFTQMLRDELFAAKGGPP